MSNAAETVKRGPGRPRKAASEVTLDVESLAAPVASIPDSELENYGGDLAAWDSVGVDRYGNRLQIARRSDYQLGTMGAHLPDLMPPGTMVHREAPELKFHWGWWEDNGTSSSRAAYHELVSKGYKPALADDWIVCPELRDTVVPDNNRRLTFAASKDGAHVVMYQSEADYLAVRKIVTRESDFVQQTAEERAAQLQEALERGGMRGVRATSTIEDD
jgi:hypothetical protein